MMDDGERVAIDGRLSLALAAAREAGAAALSRFRSGRFRVESKADATPVTEADREAEARIRAMVRGSFADDAIVGEEHGDEVGSSAWRWIIDPIDGTQSFVRGVPLWGTLVAVERVGGARGEGLGGGPVIGVIHMPALGETVWAARGGGAWHAAGDGEPVAARVSGVATLGSALCATTGFSYFRGAGREVVYTRALSLFGHTRGWSDCYAHLLVATGRADACIEPTVAVWDIAAAYPIVAEAGGRCTSWDGVIDPRSNNAVLSNGALHDAVLAAVRGSG